MTLGAVEIFHNYNEYFNFRKRFLLKWFGAALLFLAAAFLSATGVMLLLYAWNVGGWNPHPSDSSNYIISGLFFIATSSVAAYYSHRFFSKGQNFPEAMMAEIARVFKEENGFLDQETAMLAACKNGNPKQASRYFFLLKQNGNLITIKKKINRPQVQQDEIEKQTEEKTFFYIFHYQKQKPESCPFCKTDFYLKSQAEQKAKAKNLPSSCLHCKADLSFLKIK